MQVHRIKLVLLTTLIFLSWPASAINKCVDADGKVTYSAERCPENTAATIVEGTSANTPEEVYKRYRNAAVRGDITEAAKWAAGWLRAYYGRLEQPGAEDARASAVADLKKTPQSIWVIDKVEGGLKGRSSERCVLLKMRGAQESPEVGMESAETMYGIVTMVQENGAWKVNESAWVDSAEWESKWKAQGDLCL